ncbi:hypothetical protein JOE44_002167 [Chryseobacterium sp. PvR013]|nr:hypothetical protein [Chryseobacterium sp. PvR013]
MKNKKILLLILIIFTITAGSILKINHIKIFGDILLLIGSLSLVYVIINILTSKKLN